MLEREGGRCLDSELPIGDLEAESSARALGVPVVMERARVWDDAGEALMLAWAWALEVEVDAVELEGRRVVGGVEAWWVRAACACAAVTCDCGFRELLWLPRLRGCVCGLSLSLSRRLDDGDLESSLLCELPIFASTRTRAQREGGDRKVYSRRKHG